MSALAAGVGAVLCGVGGFAVPRIIAVVPEPEPEAAPEPAPESEAVPVPTVAGEDLPVRVDPEPEAPAKVLYADIAARPGLALKSAVAAAAAGAVIGALLGWSWSLVVLLPLVPVMVALSVIDWNTRLLPTWLIRPTYALTMVLVMVAAIASGEPGVVVRAALGWLAMGAFYFLLWLVYPRGLGYGDVRLSGILGLALGFVGWPELLAGAWSGFALGGVVGGMLALAKVVDRKGAPFGPFMVLGALVGLALGPALASQ